MYCDIYNVKFLILCCFTEVLAPNCFREPLRLVLLVVISVFIGFLLSWGWYLFCLNFNFYGFGVLFPVKNKVGGWLDLVGHEFWVWSTLDGGTASLKFRQFKSAVCDAFGVILFLRSLLGCC